MRARTFGNYASRSRITEKKRCALDAYSYLRYLRFLFFCKLVLSPLSCGILKIIATDAHSYSRYLRFAVVCNLAVSPLSWGFLKIIASDAYSYFRYFRFAVLTNRVCLHFPFDAQKKLHIILVFGDFRPVAIYFGGAIDTFLNDFN